MQENNLTHIEPKSMRKIRRFIRKEKRKTKIAKKAVKNNFSINIIYDFKSSKSMHSNISEKIKRKKCDDKNLRKR